MATLPDVPLLVIVVFDLVVVPLATATFGWSAAAATAAIRPQRAIAVDSVRFTTLGEAQPGESPVAPGSRIPLRHRNRTVAILLCVAVAATPLWFAAGWLRG